MMVLWIKCFGGVCRHVQASGILKDLCPSLQAVCGTFCISVDLWAFVGLNQISLQQLSTAGVQLLPLGDSVMGRSQFACLGVMHRGTSELLPNYIFIQRETERGQREQGHYPHRDGAVREAARASHFTLCWNTATLRVNELWMQKESNPGPARCT